MADTKISALTDIVTLAAGDKVPVADASDLTATKSATMTELNAYLQTLALASTQITALPAASAVAGTDTLPVDQGGTAGEATMAQLLTYIKANVFVSTSGVANSPTASQTDSITHGLGRVPTIIRIYGMSGFVANNSALPAVHSIGIWCSSGNRCLYQPYDPATITLAEPSATSTTFAIHLDTGVGNLMTGVIQNVGATTFDIAWTETGTHTAQPYLWEAM